MAYLSYYINFVSMFSYIFGPSHLPGSEEKLAVCKDLGADVCINYKTEDFVARVKEETGGKGMFSSDIFSKLEFFLLYHHPPLPEPLTGQIGFFCSFPINSGGENLSSKYSMTGVDVILDNIGGAYFQRNLDSLNVDGRLFIIGFQGGAVTEVNLTCLLARRLTVQGTEAYCACVVIFYGIMISKENQLLKFYMV